MRAEYRCIVLPLRPLRTPRELLLPGLLAATVVAMVLGSSWTSAVSMHSSKPRWAALFALCVASLWVVRRQWRLLLRVGCPLLPFVGLMILSTAWSVEPPVTLGRGLALAAVFVAAAALAVAIELRIVPAAHVGAALVVAMATVALGGLLLLAVSHNSAMHPGTGRLNGLGGDSNTVASLFALGMPLALALAFRARQRARWIASAAALLLGGSIVASGSRGALGRCGRALPPRPSRPSRPGRGRPRDHRLRGSDDAAGRDGRVAVGACAAHG
jgi:hypothetical protein